MAANQINDTDFDSKFFNYKDHHDRGITYSNYFNRNTSTVNNYNNTSDSIYYVGSGNLTENLLIPLLLSSSLSSSSSSSSISSITTTTTTTAATITSTLASAAATTFGTRKTIKSPSIFLPSLSSSLSSLTSSAIDDIDKNLTLSEYGSTITSTSILTTSNRNLNELQEHHNQHQQEKFNYTENEILSHLYEELFSWQGICLVMVFCAFIVITIIGNTLVILAVITTRRLRTVTNCFVMSLAVADLLVGIFVMPPAVAVHLIGSWQLGWVLCDIWISLDVLLCTASILSLCAISVDRYLAVTQPLTYSRKRRSKRLALIMILVVWFLALAITCPPILGWYEPGRREEVMECRYNQNEGYVIFSAMGSFFIPMSVMIYVYARISCVVASRHDKMADIGVHNNKFKRYPHDETENEQDCSEQDSTGICNKKLNAGRTLSNQTIIKDLQDTILEDNEIARQCKNGSYELVTTSTSSRTPSFKRTPSLNAKYSSVVITTGGSGGGVSIGTNVNSANTGNGSSLNLSAEHWTFGNRQHSIRHHLHHNNHHNHHHHHHHNHHHHLHTTSICNNDKYNSSGTTTTVIRNTRVHQKSLTNRITSLKRENKTTQTLSIVVGGFIACWLPFFIYYLMTPFLTEESVNPALGKFLTWLGWFNSAINPFIYAFYSVDFRAAFWRLTLKRFIKNSQKVQFPNTMSMRR